MAIGKVVVHLCLTLIIQELKISVEHDRMVTTLNIIFSVVPWRQVVVIQHITSLWIGSPSLSRIGSTTPQSMNSGIQRVSHFDTPTKYQYFYIRF